MDVVVACLVVPVAPDGIKPIAMSHGRGAGEHQHHNEDKGEREADGNSGSAHVGLLSNGTTAAAMRQSETLEPGDYDTLIFFFFPFAPATAVLMRE